MKQVYEINAEGYYVTPVIIKPIINESLEVIYNVPSNYIETTPPHGLYKAKWNGNKWVEGATLEEIDELTKPNLSLPTVDERIEQIEYHLLSPSQIYERLDKTTIHLEQLKYYKLDQLNELCNKAIVRGFVYVIENKEYLFSASVEAQGNFQGTDSLFKEGLIQEVYWSVTNTSTNIVERVRLDNELFNQVKIQLFNHINTQISKFRDFLQPLVLDASTNPEVDVINW